jgi:hypothetical protein
MELISELAIDKWGIWIDTYFFDMYIHTRTFITALIVIVILRGRKVLKDKRRKS